MDQGFLQDKRKGREGGEEGVERMKDVANDLQMDLKCPLKNYNYVKTHYCFFVTNVYFLIITTLRKLILCSPFFKRDD
jgi:hypothetical protein